MRLKMICLGVMLTSVFAFETGPRVTLGGGVGQLKTEKGKFHSIVGGVRTNYDLKLKKENISLAAGVGYDHFGETVYWSAGLETTYYNGSAKKDLEALGASHPTILKKNYGGGATVHLGLKPVKDIAFYALLGIRADQFKHRLTTGDSNIVTNGKVRKTLIGRTIGAGAKVLLDKGWALGAEVAHSNFEKLKTKNLAVAADRELIGRMKPSLTTLHLMLTHYL